VPWLPADWKGWETAEPAGAFPHLEALRAILSRLADRESTSLAWLAGSPVPVLPEGRFDGVFRARLDARGLASLRRRFDVVVVLDSPVAPARLAPRATFDRLRRSLVEGGVLVGSFAARPRRGTPFVLGREAATLAFHEVELQYRLHCCGFQGQRIRRVSAAAGDVLLCMAVRRALN
jgi:hypothetical protein